MCMYLASRVQPSAAGGRGGMRLAFVMMKRLCAVLLLALPCLVMGMDVDVPSQLRAETVRFEKYLWSKVVDPRWHEVTDAGEPGPGVAVAREFVELTAKLDPVAAKAEAALSKTPAVEGWWVWIMLAELKRKTDAGYDKFKTFMQHQAKHGGLTSPQQEWLDVIDSVKGVANVTDEMHDLIVHGHLYKQIVKESERHACELQQSQSQLLYNVYNAILLTEIKGYAVQQFSWMLLKLYGKGNFTHESDMARTRFEERTALTMTTAKLALADADSSLWRCDPELHVEGETYVQLTRLLQGYIENEVDMNSENTCRENCGFYSVAENHGCFKDQFCSHQPPCTGKILRCHYIDSDMTICQAPRTSMRRYEWIEYENKRVYGRKSKCLRGTTKVDSWWRWLFWHCSYCMCVCDQRGGNSDRFFSLKEVKANVRNNKVIVGLRFVKQNRIVHLQINEGTLLPGGEIDPKSIAWRKVDDIDVRRAVLNEDYHEMSDTERAIDLDDLVGPVGSVLTGVRFRKVGAHLNFEIQTMPFNFTTGTLISEKAVWLSNDNTGASSNPRTELLLLSPDIPTKTILPSRIDSGHDQFLKFTHSDFDMDAAQSTVPFIDTQAVVPSIPVPLTGAGIYHKGQRYFGGFVAPKVFTYNFYTHMQSSVPSNSHSNNNHHLPNSISFDVKVL